MMRTPAWRRYARFWGARVQEDVDDELAFHVDMLVRDYMARGLDERAARDAAEQRLGDRRGARDRCITIGQRRTRRMRRAQGFDAFVQDVRYALRTLNRQKAWTAMAVVTMALGIGASTAMFSAMNSLILNPLRYRDAGRVVMLWRADAKSGLMIPLTGPMLSAAKAQTNLFEDFLEFGSVRSTMTGRGDATSLVVGKVPSNFFAFAGVPLIAGRGFAPDETRPGAAHVALISEGVSRERFGGRASALGQRIVLDDVPYTIVGITPGHLGLPSPSDNGSVDAWLPLVHDGGASFSLVAAHLRPGVSIPDATRQLGEVVAREHLALAKSPLGGTMMPRLVRTGELLEARQSLLLLSGAVALLLLVACANVAHLLLARGASRAREIAIRTAIGASQWRLARQLLTESGVLAVAGCVLGVLIAYGGVHALRVLRPESLDVLGHVTLDGTSLVAAVGLSIAAGLAFGCTTALHGIRHVRPGVLRLAAQDSTTGASSVARYALVITEMALSSMLLVGAALLVRSVVALERVDIGFDTRGLYSMSLNLPNRYYPTDAARDALAERIMDATRHVAGVEAVTASAATPPNAGGFSVTGIEVEGVGRVNESSLLPMNFVLPSYFATLGIPLDGSPFTASSGDAKDIIVSRGFASKYFGDGRAVGRRIRFAAAGSQPNQGWMRIIGVAANVAAQGLSADPTQPVLYRPLDPHSGLSHWAITVRVRPGVDPTLALRTIVRSIDRRLIPPSVTTIAADLARSIAGQRFTMLLLAAFAVTAVLLSAIGLFGVMSYAVTQRAREIGIRIALGATAARVAKTIVVRGLVLSAAGLLAGFLAAAWGARLLAASLFGITSTDPASYVAAAIILVGISVVACVVPMRRAMRVDPLVAMRGD